MRGAEAFVVVAVVAAERQILTRGARVVERERFVVVLEGPVDK